MMYDVAGDYLLPSGAMKKNNNQIENRSYREQMLSIFKEKNSHEIKELKVLCCNSLMKIYLVIFHLPLGVIPN